MFSGLGWLLLVAIAGLLPLAGADAAVAIKAARLGNTPDAQRIVIELSGPIGYKYFSLSNPHRLVVDLEGVEANPEALKQLAAKLLASDPYIAGLRVAANRPGVTRLVTELKVAMRPLVSLLAASADIGPRLVIDLVPGVSAVAKPGAAPVAAASVNVAPASLVAKSGGTPKLAEPVEKNAKSGPVAESGKSASREPLGPTLAPIQDKAAGAETRPVREKATAQDIVAGQDKVEARGVASGAEKHTKQDAPATDEVVKPAAMVKLTAADKSTGADRQASEKINAVDKVLALDKQVEQAIQQSGRAAEDKAAKSAKIGRAHV
jgi:hypothetical protein